MGFQVGFDLHNIRVGGAYSEHRHRLEALGVNFEVKKIDVRGFDVIYSALEAAVHGNLFLAFLKVWLSFVSIFINLLIHIFNRQGTAPHLDVACLYRPVQRFR
jgi:hypothetical protein